jgi:hypothetical protein
MEAGLGSNELIILVRALPRNDVVDAFGLFLYFFCQSSLPFFFFFFFLNSTDELSNLQRALRSGVSRGDLSSVNESWCIKQRAVRR